jgi:chromate transport protein ChrA
MNIIWGVLPFVLVALYLALCIYIGVDMNRRVQRGWLYGVLAVVAPVVGVILWAIARGSHPPSARNSGVGRLGIGP